MSLSEIVRIMLTVIPMLAIIHYYKEKDKKITGYVVGFIWASGFGIFCGLTGFLRG